MTYISKLYSSDKGRVGHDKSDRRNTISTLFFRAVAHPLTAASQFLQAFRLTLSSFAAQRRGNVVMTFAVVSPAVILAMGAGLDYSYLSLSKSKLQAAVDAATIAAGREVRLANANQNHILAVAKNVVTSNLKAKGSKVTVNARVTNDPLMVTVSATQKVDMIIMGDYFDGNIFAEAAAEIMGGSPICVLGLEDEKKHAAITLERSARITGGKCSIYSNSTGKKSLVSYDGALMRADFICTAGGFIGSVNNFLPRPMTDCPKVPDPLIDRAPPPIGACTHTNLRLDVEEKLKIDDRSIDKWVREETKYESGKNANQANNKTEKTPKGFRPRSDFTVRSVVLNPGVYCGGLSIGSAVQVTLNPGEYIMKDGPLYVGDYASITGNHVGFYFSGDHSNLFFGPNSTVSLRAPAEGPMAGLLFFEDRDRPKLKPYAILSDNARLLEGTIYFPQSRFYIDADAPVADQSAYTAIIARRLDLFAGPHLVLNTNYDLTDVPVPEGIARNGKIILRK